MPYLISFTQSVSTQSVVYAGIGVEAGEITGLLTTAALSPLRLLGKVGYRQEDALWSS